MAMGRKPTAKSLSMISICCGVSSTIVVGSRAELLLAQGRCEGARARHCARLCRRGIRFRSASFQLSEDLAQRGDQLIARNVALLKLNAEPKGLVLRFELKNERLRALRSGLLLAAFAPRFIARQPALHDAVEHLDHLFFGRLARDLQQERLGKDRLLNALLSQRIRNIPQRKRFGNRRACPPDFLRNILVRVLKLCAETM